LKNRGAQGQLEQKVFLESLQDVTLDQNNVQGIQKIEHKKYDVCRKKDHVAIHRPDGQIDPFVVVLQEKGNVRRRHARKIIVVSRHVECVFACLLLEYKI